jgi:ribonuclease E
MDTPQYEVKRVRQDETVADVSYEMPIIEAVDELAVMPKFDATAVKIDEPKLQGMSSPKRVVAPQNKVKDTIEEDSNKPQNSSFIKKIGKWLSGLFQAEEEIPEVKVAEPKAKPTRNTNPRNKKRQGPNTRKNNNRRDETSADDKTPSKNVKGNKSAQTSKNQKPTSQTKPVSDKPKEEKVAEKRQRRDTRKKVRTSPKRKAEKEIITTSVDVIEAETKPEIVEVEIKEQVQGNEEQNTREERPRNRRSPRHLRSQGQRRKKPESNPDIKPMYDEQNEVTTDPVKTRYPNPKEIAETEAAETSVNEVVIAETVEVAEVQTLNTEIAEKPIVNKINVVEEPVVEINTEERTEVQPDLPLELPNADAAENDVLPDSVDETTVQDQNQSSLVEEKTDQNNVEQSNNDIQKADVTTEDSDVNVNVEVTAKEASSEVEVVETSVAEKVEPVKAVKPKPIKKVLKQTTAKGKASSPMTKPITVNTVNELPTESFSVEQRSTVSSSGKQAMVANASNHASATATKP